MITIASRTLRKSRITRRGFNQDIVLFWVQDRKKKWYRDSHDGQWDSNSKNGHPIFKGTSALSRGILKQTRSKSTFHFNGDPLNTKLSFQTVHSLNQISVRAAVTDWCYQFALTNEEEQQVVIPVDNGVLTMVEPQMEMLLFRTWHLETVCKEARVSECRKRRCR